MYPEDQESDDFTGGAPAPTVPSVDAANTDATRWQNSIATARSAHQNSARFALKYGADLGIAPQDAYTNPEDAKAQALQNAAQERAARIAPTAPATSAYFGAPLNQAAFGDDAESLGIIEKSVNAIRNFLPSNNPFDAAYARTYDAQAAQDPTMPARPTALDKLIRGVGEQAIRPVADALLGVANVTATGGRLLGSALENDFAATGLPRALNPGALMHDYFGKAADDNAYFRGTYGLGGSTLEPGSFGAATQSGVSSLYTNLLTMPFAMESAAVAAPRYATLAWDTLRGVTPGALVSGASAAEDARQAGLSGTDQILYGARNFSEEALGEMIPFGKLLGDIHAGTPLMKTIMHQIVAENVSEQITQHVQDADEWLTLHPERSMADYMAERPNAAFQTAVATTMSSLVMGGLGYAMSRNHRAAQQQQDAADKALNVTSSLDDAFKAAGQSQLHKDMPAAFRQLVQEQANGNDVGDAGLYVDAKALHEVLAQASDDTVAQIVQHAPSIAAQLPEALAVGGTVRIPTGELVTAFTGTGLEQAIAPHMMADPNDMSMAQVQEQHASGQQAALAQQAEQVLTEVSDKATWNTSVKQVSDTILGQLNAGGRFTPSVNKGYAEAAANFYAVNAHKLGLQPHELYEQYPLTSTAAIIDASTQAAPVLDQPRAPLLQDDTGQPLRFQPSEGGATFTPTTEPTTPGVGLAMANHAEMDAQGLLRQDGTAPDRRVTPDHRAEGTGGRRVSDEVLWTKNPSEMTPEELHAAIEHLRYTAQTSPLTGLGNKIAWQRVPKKAHIASLDADGLKWVNDNLGHESGDEMLTLIGKALHEVGLEAYHVSGDEYWAQSNDETDLKERLQKAQEIITKSVVANDQWSLKGLSFSFGIANNEKQAEQEMHHDKEDRQAAGLRPERGGSPAGARRFGEAGYIAPGEAGGDRANSPGGVLEQSSGPSSAGARQPLGDSNASTNGADSGGISEPGRAGGSPGVVADARGADTRLARESDGSLLGLPRKVGERIASAWQPAHRVAEAYMKAAGLPYAPPTTYVKVDPERATRIANAFEEMGDDPADPTVHAAYTQLMKETEAQFKAIMASGLKVEFIGPDQEDPYHNNPRNMTEDVRNNNHMWVYSSKEGFGTTDVGVEGNPLLAETPYDFNGQPALANDLFRVVHDYFGHVKEGVGFRADGEENAWRAHAAMYSPLARRAMTSETRGQNSWVNYGPYGEANRTASSADTHYADQKQGLLPEWASSEGMGDELSESQKLEQALGGKALTANTEALTKAQDMERTGATREAILAETGWFQGRDGKWRFEISDITARLRAFGVNAEEIISKVRDNTENDDRRVTLGDLLRHDPLFNAYPELRSIVVDTMAGSDAAYSNRDPEGTIQIGRDMPGSMVRAAIMHEVQHAIQETEGFAPGGSVANEGVQIALAEGKGKAHISPEEAASILAYHEEQRKAAQRVLERISAQKRYKGQTADWRDAKGAVENIETTIAKKKELFAQRTISREDAYEGYRKLAGEVEARNADGRSNMGTQELRDTPPWETQDIPDEAQVIWNRRPLRSQAIAAATVEQRGARATFDPASLTINLLPQANLSSYLHELGHAFFELTGKFAAREGAPESIRTDMDILLRWGSVPGETAEARLDHWLALPLNDRRELHEKFAETFEKYLFTGKAPSLETRGLFQRFAAWMKSVYSNMENFDATRSRADLSPEVQGVMNRMLASDDAIANAESVRGMTSLPEEALANLSPAERENYDEAASAANDSAEEELRVRSIRDMKWLSGAKSRALKSLQAQAAGLRATVRTQVADELAKQPVRQAIAFLRNGELPDVKRNNTERKVIASLGGVPHKLALADLKEMYGMGPAAPWRYLKVGKYGEAAVEGVHPDLIAGLFGYPSGDAMVRDILAAPPLKETIENLTDQRMLEEHGDITDPKALALAADEAVHNDARARMVATELTALTRMVGGVKLATQMAKDYAAKVLGQTALRDIRPGQSAAAAAKAGREADAALKKNDLKAAATAKRNQLLHIEATKQGYEAQRDIDKAMAFFKKVFGPDARLAKNRNMDIVQAARGVLSAYGIGPAGASPAEALAKIKEYNPQLHDDLVSIMGELPQGITSPRDLTLDEFRAAHDTVQSLWHLSRRVNQIQLNGEMVDIAEVAGQLVDGIKDRHMGELPDIVGLKGTPTDGDKRKANALGILAAVAHVENWTDTLGGAFKTAIWRPIIDATTRYRAVRNGYIAEYLGLLKTIEKGITFDRITAPELDGFTFNAGKAEVLHALLHTGNESNLRKLLLGRQWATEREDGSLDTHKWDAFVARMANEGQITKADYDFAQGVWDLMEKMKPGAQKAHHDMYGYYFNEITANEVHTPFGVYKGGYVPAIADSMSTPEAAQQREQEQLLQSGNSFMFPTTGKGFSKSRVEYNRPLELDLRTIGSHIDKVSRFTHLEPAIKDVGRLLINKQVARALNGHNPAAISLMLNPWLQRTAQQTVSVAGKYRGADQFWMGLRKRAGISIMAGNALNALQQLTGIVIGAAKVPAPVLLRSMRNYLANPAQTTRDISELSPWMAERLDSQSFAMADEIKNILINPSVFATVKDFTARHGYFFQSAFQNITDTVVWRGAYEHALEQGKEQGEAIYHADETVRLTQGSFNPEDIAAFSHNTPFTRLFLQFSDYFSMLINLGVSESRKVVHEMGLSKATPHLSYLWFTVLAMPAFLSQIISAGAPDDPDDPDGNSTLWSWMKMFFSSQAQTVAASVPVAGQAVNYVANLTDDKRYNDRLQLAPALSLVEASGRGAVSIFNGTLFDEQVKKGEVRDALSLVAMATGFPTGSIAKAAGYLTDVHNEKPGVKADDPVDVAKGLLTGR